ncbi:MAG: threonine-phosphate decarboxylase [Pseudomonadota bacterium]
MSFEEDPLHGGDLVSASDRYGIPIEDWTDLSTGINPVPYPVGPIPPSVMTQLPYQRREFEGAVCSYYGRHNWLAVSGSQAAIQALPSWLPELPALVPDVGYQEHAYQWLNAGLHIERYPAMAGHAAALTALDKAINARSACHLVLIQPNNPSGLLLSIDHVLDCASRLTDGGCVVADEAFIDTSPGQSLLRAGGDHWPHNLIVLRSFGKFFGLAGLRLGFIFAAPERLAAIRRLQGPWAVNGPAQWVAQQALKDVAWQTQARLGLEQNSAMMQRQLEPLFVRLGATLVARTSFFHSYLMSAQNGHALADQLAEQGILVRVIDENEGLTKGSALIRLGIEGGRLGALKTSLDCFTRLQS